MLEWDNGIEATICCSVGDFRFAFFAMDYYENKKSYVAGDSLSMDVSALGCKVKEASRGFSFEGQQAVDWLAKIGQKPDIDQSGNIQPVKFSTEKLVAFLNHDERCPDEAEFQSPITSISSTLLLDVDFYLAEMTIFRNEDGIEINIIPESEITIDSKSLIIEAGLNELFDGNFNLVYPELKPGKNTIIVTGDVDITFELDEIEEVGV